MFCFAESRCNALLFSLTIKPHIPRSFCRMPSRSKLNQTAADGSAAAAAAFGWIDEHMFHLNISAFFCCLPLHLSLSFWHWLFSLLAVIAITVFRHCCCCCCKRPISSSDIPKNLTFAGFCWWCTNTSPKWRKKAKIRKRIKPTEKNKTGKKNIEQKST